MHIISLMDYTDRRSIIMCCAWIELATRYNSGAKITIFHTKPIPRIQAFAGARPKVRFVQFSIPQATTRLTGGFTHRPVQDLQLGLWHQLSRLHIYKFIYVDADAFIIDSLDDWWSIIGEKPLIGIPERILSEGGVLLNAGVFSYADKNGFITFQKLLDQYNRDGEKIIFQAGQQGLLNAYLRRIRYDFRHPRIGHEYNVLAKYSRIVQFNDDQIAVYSGRYPFRKKIKHLITGRREWSADWLGWKTTKRAKIIHAFGGKGYKFWELQECNSLWEYCEKIYLRG